MNEKNYYEQLILRKEEIIRKIENVALNSLLPVEVYSYELYMDDSGEIGVHIRENIDAVSKKDFCRCIFECPSFGLTDKNFKAYLRENGYELDGKCNRSIKLSYSVEYNKWEEAQKRKALYYYIHAEEIYDEAVRMEYEKVLIATVQ